ncbi:MAG: DUF308 domain-containing protein [Oscillospiraceae bacterium]|nr:DUF308 domain-containing protein [Clostridia bacterium]MBQ9167393.1 DUF308 domain-containing protein [Oscillospiraceae bacterium]
MKALKEYLSPIVFAIFELVVGILLMINPVNFTVGIITAAGVVMILYGIINVIKYFRLDAKTAAAGQTLAQGLCMMLLGAFCTMKSEWFIATFPVLTMIYGVVTLLAGVSKVQLTVDLLRQKNKKWFWGAISALVSIVCAIIILDSPFTTTTVLWMFTGISLVVEAVFDFITVIMSGRETAA